MSAGRLKRCCTAHAERPALVPWKESVPYVYCVPSLAFLTVSVFLLCIFYPCTCQQASCNMLRTHEGIRNPAAWRSRCALVSTPCLVADPASFMRFSQLIINVEK